MKTLLASCFFAAALAICAVRAQSPTPIIVQAASPPAAAAQSHANTAATADPRMMLQSLQEMRATNIITLKKQEAALLTLDELQKAAEELKTFSKRG